MLYKSLMNLFLFGAVLHHVPYSSFESPTAWFGAVMLWWGVVYAGLELFGAATLAMSALTDTWQRRTRCIEESAGMASRGSLIVAACVVTMFVVVWATVAAPGEVWVHLMILLVYAREYVNDASAIQRDHVNSTTGDVCDGLLQHGPWYAYNRVYLWVCQYVRGGGQYDRTYVEQGPAATPKTLLLDELTAPPKPEVAAAIQAGLERIIENETARVVAEMTPVQRAPTPDSTGHNTPPTVRAIATDRHPEVVGVDIDKLNALVKGRTPALLPIENVVCRDLTTYVIAPEEVSTIDLSDPILVVAGRRSQFFPYHVVDGDRRLRRVWTSGGVKKKIAAIVVTDDDLLACRVAEKY